jgi:hypothetical protein
MSPVEPVAAKAPASSVIQKRWRLASSTLYARRRTTTVTKKTTWERACEECNYHDPYAGVESAKIRALSKVAFALCELVDAIKARAGRVL